MTRKKQGGATENISEQRGVIDEVLPKSMYRVRLSDGRALRAGIDATARHGIVRLLEGDAVLVRPYPNDPTRAQITRKL